MSEEANKTELMARQFREGQEAGNKVLMAAALSVMGPAAGLQEPTSEQFEEMMKLCNGFKEQLIAKTMGALQALCSDSEVRRCGMEGGEDICLVFASGEKANLIGKHAIAVCKADARFDEQMRAEAEEAARRG